jgi:glycosyltransferase involved in cell wall biosynthesis
MANTMISFIIPAHNEEALIGQTLDAIHAAARDVGEEYEIVVVDDASTDATAQLAEEHGARIVPVNHRQIARTRNSGGRAARGERLFFIDADTTANAMAVAAALRAMDKGAVGGGGLVRFDGRAPLYISLIAAVSVIPAKLIGFCGGAFMFCTRDAFLKSGGFDESMFWAEEGAFALRLKRLGWFEIIWPRVVTSSRRLRTLSGRQGLSFLKTLLRGRKIFTSRESVKEIWYDSNRAGDSNVRSSGRIRIVNGLLFLATISLITGPVWTFIPWAATPLTTLFGKLRFVNAVFICHVTLVFWPFAILLFLSLLRQPWSREWIRLAATTAFCVWQAFHSLVNVSAIWMLIFSWVAP